MSDDNQSKGVLVFYLNVGQLPPFKAEAYVDRVKERLFAPSETQTHASLPKNISVIILPVRYPNETFVDYIPFEGMTKDAVDELREIRLSVRNMFMEADEEWEETEEDEPLTWFERVKSWFGW